MRLAHIGKRLPLKVIAADQGAGARRTNPELVEGQLLGEGATVTTFGIVHRSEIVGQRGSS